MKLIWHIFLKDLRRLAVPLALWAALLAAKYAFGWHMIGWEGADENQFKRMVGVEVLLIALECIACFLLTTRLVHEDPLVGREAFWVTRPISGARLLAAKILGAVVFFAVLPLAIEVPWWLANHYGWAEMKPAIFEALIWQIAIVAPAMLLAVLTDGLSRVLLWTLVVAAFATWWLLLATAGGPSNADWRGLIWTRSCVELTFGTATIAAVVALQYLTRRRARSIGVVVAGVIAIGITTQVWPWDWAPVVQRLMHGTVWVNGSLEKFPLPMENGELTFTVAHAHVPQFTAHSPDGLEPRLDLGYQVEGVPDDRTIISGHLTHAWRWSDGMTIGREAGFGGWWRWSSSLDAVKRRALGLMPTKPARNPAESINTTAYLTRSLANRMHQDPPAYAATITVLVARPEAVLDSAVQAEPRRWIEASSVRVIGPRWRKDGAADAVDVVTVETRPVQTRFVQTLSRLIPAQDDKRVLQYWLVDRAAGVAFTSPGRYGTRIDVGTVRIAWEMNWISSWAEGDGTAPRFITRLKAGFEPVRLVGVAFRDERLFQSQLTVPRFVVEK